MPQGAQAVSATLVAGTPVNIVAANGAGQQIKAGRGMLNSFTVNTAGTGSTATFYDGTSAAGTKLGAFSTTAQINFDLLGWSFKTGLFVVTTGTVADVTVSYT